MFIRRGPKRFDYSEKDDAWFYSRDGDFMQSLLHRELREAFDQDIDLELEDISTKLE
jgi:frataxin